ncbi:MAG TPA: alpha/beta hydrolase-fold protein [Armatimonadota bacterium]|jgi:predicted alpha/beta superfamily hydrolase
MNAFRGIACLILALPALAHADDRPSTRTGDFRDFPAFASTVLGNVRKVTVMLPPSYAASPQRRYPVLYAHDLQNLFDEKGSFIGKEWRLDETLTQMWSAKRIPEIIVVGIANTPKRMSEYMPGPTGDQYVRFITVELKPFIDNRFRTKRGPADTAMMGSSMGALISVWGSLTRPDVFGGAAGLSPAMQFADEIRTRMESERPSRIHWYLDVGTDEIPGDAGQRLVQAFRDARSALVQGGYREGTDFVAEVIPGGVHNEVSWAARVDKPLEFLFGGNDEAPKTHR